MSEMKSDNGHEGIIPHHDYIIIGAGPAGLQLGYYFEKAGQDYLILEAGDSPGTFFKTFPRHRTLISINKVYTGYEDPEINLRWDWNSLLSDDIEMLFKNYTKKYFPAADHFVEYLGDFAARFHLKIQYGARAARIARPDGFRIECQDGKVYHCHRLIIATGLFKLYDPQIPGFDLAEKYTDVTIDPQDFVNQRVLVVGKGNSAFETAENLVETASLIHIASPHPLQMAWRTKFVGHLRAINNNFLDTYQLKLQNVVIDAQIKKIERVNGHFEVQVVYTHAHGEEEKLTYDRIIMCTGWRFDDSIFDDSCRPALTFSNKFPDQTSEWESVNIKDLYFAGTLMQMRDYKKKQSGFIHGFRYNVHALHRILELKYEGKEWPNQVIPATPESVVEAIIKRVNTTSALWQQTGFLCDLVVMPQREGDSARYYQDLPADYVHDSAFGRNDRYYTVTLDFGFDVINSSPDPFAIERVHKDNAEDAALSSAIHPIVRGYSRGSQISEHHIIEDLASEWKEPVHTSPLTEFFSKELQRISAPATLSQR